MKENHDYIQRKKDISLNKVRAPRIEQATIKHRPTSLRSPVKSLVGVGGLILSDSMLFTRTMKVQESYDSIALPSSNFI